MLRQKCRYREDTETHIMSKKKKAKVEIKFPI